MKIYGGMKVQRYAFLASTAEGGEWSSSSLTSLFPGEVPQSPLDHKLNESQGRSACRGEDSSVMQPPA
jgi:hypothetical protein